MPPSEKAERDRSADRGSRFPPGGASRWAYLADHSDRPEVQEIIRSEIRKGTIRVAPMPGCSKKVRILDHVPSHNNRP